MKIVDRLIALSSLLSMPAWMAMAHPDHEAQARFLANEGVMVSHGDTKILIDAFYRNSYGRLALVPTTIERDVMDGVPPFDGIDVVLVSHVHGDHFTAEPMIAYLRANPAVMLFAPEQATDKIAENIAAEDKLWQRITSIDLTPGDAPVLFEQKGLIIDAVAIPHSGGQRMAAINNLVFRVRIEDGVSAMHFGDADPNDRHFAPHQDHWDAHHPDVAFPPYWWLSNRGDGRAILQQRIKPGVVIGVHLPAASQGKGDDWRDRLGSDAFTDPGEFRIIPLK